MRPAIRKAEENDTVIIGAGAAGLAAACELSAANHGVTMLEARDRLGGRILTERRPAIPLPIELGAEFIHGESSAVMGWLKRANQVAVGISGDRWRLRNGQLQSSEEAWDEMKRRFERLSPPRPDVPFAEFLRRHSRSIPPAVREMACHLVEGFDAADASKISAREVMEEWSSGAAADAPTFRPAQGYDGLIEAMRQALHPDRVQLRLGAVVREIAWRKGHVSITAQRHGEALKIEAQRAIVTLPIGVLQLPPASPNSVRFLPEIRSKRAALARLAAGPVTKLVMIFARPFWAELQDGRYRKAGFFFAQHAAFPTFWTSLPMHTPMLVAWTAGPNASRLARANRDVLTAKAIECLRMLFGRRVSYSSLLESVFWHDWQSDPFACGAYSYVMARGAKARRSLAEPLEETLYFAGEACDTNDEAATVGGALQSGARAAREVLERLQG